jgi:hypothetical protein
VSRLALAADDPLDAAAMRVTPGVNSVCLRGLLGHVGVGRASEDRLGLARASVRDVARLGNPDRVLALVVREGEDDVELIRISNEA